MKRWLAVLLLGVSLVGCSKGGPKIENTLFLASGQKIKGMDPAAAQDLYASSEIMRVYEGLLQFHPFKRPYVLEPLLAEAMPKVSANGLEYTFKIRKGVLFHDDAAFADGKGREVTAEDFIYSIKRVADPKVQSTGWWLFEGRISGLDEWREKAKKSAANYDEKIAGLQAMDSHTIKFRLKAPYPQFLYALAMPYSAVVSKEAVEKYGQEFLNHAVGTGPFILETFKPTEVITYVKNPKYWPATFPTEFNGDASPELKADAGKALPFVDRIEMRIIIESQPRWLHFMRGEIDTVAIPKDNFNDAITGDKELRPELKEKGINLIKESSLDLTYTAMNLDSPEVPQFKDKRIRRAISLAIDEKEVLRVFFNGMGIPAQTPVPPGIKGYDPKYKNPWRTNNIDLARKLMAEAGYPGGKGFPVVNYDTVASTDSRQMAEYAVRQLAQIGITLKVNSNTWPALLQRVQQRQTHMWGIAWGADYPDAENFLQLFYGPNAQPGGMNGAYYRNKEYDKIFERARIMQDSPERTRLYEQLAQIVAEDVPVVLGLHRMSLTLVQPWIKNIRYQEFGINSAKYIRVDVDGKREAAGKKK